jgi:hypothetical protein
LEAGRWRSTRLHDASIKPQSKQWVTETGRFRIGCLGDSPIPGQADGRHSSRSKQNRSDSFANAHAKSSLSAVAKKVTA